MQGGQGWECFVALKGRDMLTMGAARRDKL
jgi:hypothetical protein